MRTRSIFRPAWWAPGKTRAIQILRIRQEGPGHVGLALTVDGRPEGLGIDEARLRSPSHFVGVLHELYGPNLRIRPEPRDWRKFVDRKLAESG